MKIAWKEERKYKISEVLSKLESMITPGDNGGFSSHSFEIHEVLAALETMLKFPPAAEEFNRRGLIIRGISKVLKADMTKEGVLKSINCEFTSAHATTFRDYHLLTSISSSDSVIPKRAKINGVALSLCTSGKYPPRYGSRDLILGQHHVRELEITEHKDYTPVILRLRAKTPLGALKLGIRSLDLLRASWCLSGNPGMKYGGWEWDAINVIRLGAFHTIHHPDGTQALQDPSYDPGFTRAKPFKPYDLGRFNRKRSELQSLVTAKSLSGAYREKIESSLLLYVRSFDEPSPGPAFLGSWSAMENLCLGKGETSEMIIERCSSLFLGERDYHKGMLAHQRERRNQYVHSGEVASECRLLCYQIQSYFLKMLEFYLYWRHDFADLTEANHFLELSHDIEQLKREIAARKRFIRVING